MPNVFKFYIRHCLIGFGVAAVFIAAILYFNIANLWHLISTSDIGLMALVVFWVLNGIVFAGVQTAIATMLMAETPHQGGSGGSPVGPSEPVADYAFAQKRRSGP